MYCTVRSQRSTSQCIFDRKHSTSGSLPFPLHSTAAPLHSTRENFGSEQENENAISHIESLSAYHLISLSAFIAASLPISLRGDPSRLLHKIIVNARKLDTFPVNTRCSSHKLLFAVLLEHEYCTQSVAVQHSTVGGAFGFESEANSYF